MQQQRETEEENVIRRAAKAQIMREFRLKQKRQECEADGDVQIRKKHYETDEDQLASTGLYNCDVCMKKFTNLSELEEHIPIQCERSDRECETRVKNIFMSYFSAMEPLSNSKNNDTDVQIEPSNDKIKMEEQCEIYAETVEKVDSGIGSITRTVLDESCKETYIKQETMDVEENGDVPGELFTVKFEPELEHCMDGEGTESIGRIDNGVNIKQEVLNADGNGDIPPDSIDTDVCDVKVELIPPDSIDTDVCDVKVELRGEQEESKCGPKSMGEIDRGMNIKQEVLNAGGNGDIPPDSIDTDVCDVKVELRGEPGKSKDGPKSVEEIDRDFNDSTNSNSLIHMGKKPHLVEDLNTTKKRHTEFMGMVANCVMEKIRKANRLEAEPVKVSDNPESSTIVSSNSSHVKQNKKKAPAKKSIPLDVVVKQIDSLISRKKVCAMKKHRVILNQYDCEICAKTFKQYHNLYMHREFYCKVRRFVCNICKDVFNKSIHLRLHESIHGDGERRLKSCPRVSLQRLPLVQHQCEMCAKTFIQQHKLDMHRDFYCKFRRFACNVCKDVFREPIYLRLHETIHEEGERQLKPCPRVSLQRLPLVKHECESCMKTFMSIYSLRELKRSKQQICESCVKTSKILFVLNERERM